MLTESNISLSREVCTFEWFPNVIRDDVVRIGDWLGRTVLFAGVDPSDVDVDTENYPFGGVFCRVQEEGGKEVSSILAVPLCAMEQATDRSFYNMPPEGLPCFVSRCAHIAYMQVRGEVMNEEEMEAGGTWE